MLSNNLVESGIARLGAEQEFVLVNDNFKPSDKAVELLHLIKDDHFTKELAKFNLEINLDPEELSNDCFSVIENKLREFLRHSKEKAKEIDTKVLLKGILPTIRNTELLLEYMTPDQRYYALNDMLKRTRGQDFELHMLGVDEITVKSDSVLFEACNTSFQMHLQIDPEDFVDVYNWSQAISGPLLSISTNSPILLGRELWSETRIALFQQSVDTRKSSHALKESKPRVTFGDRWIRSVTDIFKDDVARYKLIVMSDIEEDSLDTISKGKTPELRALRIHNGTNYRWNRPCYGVFNNKAHLRIENRYIPAGPTIQDEITNFAFWVGLLKGMPDDYRNIWNKIDFREAKANFIKAARSGKETSFNWEGNQISAKELIIDLLIPIAKKGLKKSNVDENDIVKYLEIIEKRTYSQTGSQWKRRNYRNLNKVLKQYESLVTLTKTIYENQVKGIPVHEWENIDIEPFKNLKKTYSRVDDIMTTDLITVMDNDPAFLAFKIMDWRNIHHLPVENSNGDLVGTITSNHYDRFKNNVYESDATINDIMRKDAITISPDSLISEAKEIMIKNQVGSLPVISRDCVVGIITKKDIIEAEKND